MPAPKGSRRREARAETILKSRLYFLFPFLPTAASLAYSKTELISTENESALYTVNVVCLSQKMRPPYQEIATQAYQ